MDGQTQTKICRHEMKAARTFFYEHETSSRRSAQLTRRRLKPPPASVWPDEIRQQVGRAANW